MLGTDCHRQLVIALVVAYTFADPLDNARHCSLYLNAVLMLIMASMIMHAARAKR